MHGASQGPRQAGTGDARLDHPDDGDADLRAVQPPGASEYAGSANEYGGEHQQHVPVSLYGPPRPPFHTNGSMIFQQQRNQQSERPDQSHSYRRPFFLGEHGTNPFFSCGIPQKPGPAGSLFQRLLEPGTLRVNGLPPQIPRFRHSNRLILHFLMFQADNRQNASAMEPADRKLKKKTIFPLRCGDTPITFDSRGPQNTPSGLPLPRLPAWSPPRAGREGPNIDGTMATAR